MPLYDFRCEACDKTFELLLRGGDEPACPTCGSKDVFRLVSRPSPPGKSKGIIAAGRAAAKREGHLSNF